MPMLCSLIYDMYYNFIKNVSKLQISMGVGKAT
jgi:hypothetical protein